MSRGPIHPPEGDQSMRTHHTTDRSMFEPLEGRRMLSATISDLPAHGHGPAWYAPAAATHAPLVGPTAGHQVPFHGTLDATVTRGGSPSAPFVTLTGTGHAAHLGRFTFSAPHEVN